MRLVKSKFQLFAESSGVVLKTGRCSRFFLVFFIKWPWKFSAMIMILEGERLAAWHFLAVMEGQRNRCQMQGTVLNYQGIQISTPTGISR
jgi:hypothetical protein